MAMGPKMSNNINVIHVNDRYFIVSNSCFRQWRDDMDRFTIVLFTEGMNQKAIDAKLTNGWMLGTTSVSNWRYEYLDPYVETSGSIEWIYKNHNIPANEPI